MDLTTCTTATTSKGYASICTTAITERGVRQHTATLVKDFGPALGTIVELCHVFFLNELGL